MPIFVKESPEPFTFGSASSAPLLAECEAYRCLLASILRYGKREIMGRSVLISGHRGCGKTTLVRWAVQQAQEKLRDNPAAARPLLVPLHGPDLLGGESVLATDPKSAEAAKPQGAERDDRDTRAALRMLTEALHRAYVSELGRALSELTTKDESLHELAAQLIVELDHAPDLDALRYIWNRTGKLQSGVLFPAANPPLRDNRQGYRELLAASAVIEGYRRVAGKLEGVDGSLRQAEKIEKADRKTDWSGKDFLNPLTGLLAGGAAGAGVLMSGAGGAVKPLAAALAGLIAAVGSTSVLNYSSSRTRKNSRESKSTFTWDTSIASLDRMLPVMVERIVDAGLAPIFVVDELDKIPDLENKMEHLIHHLKHLVTEKTFFCFLTERSYFEHIVTSSRTKVYGKEHTFFSDRLFVHYSPQDLHKYLFDILSRDNLTDNEQLDRLVLPYFLLERSKMHPIDLRRALSDLTDPKAAITLPVGTVRQPEGYGMAVLIQAAVETILDEPEWRGRLSQDPNFARIAHDALYLPARSWESGAASVTLTREALRCELEMRMQDDDHATSRVHKLSDADLDLLHAAVQRLTTFLLDPQSLITAMSMPAISAETGPSEMGDDYKKFREEQRNAVRQVIPVIDLLLGVGFSEGAYQWMRDAFGRWRPPMAFPMPVHGPIPLPIPVPVPEAVPFAVAADSGPYAAPIAPAPAPPPPAAPAPAAPEPARVSPFVPAGGIPVESPPPPSTTERIRQIRDLDAFARSVSGGRLDLDKLASQVHLLGISPAWPSVENSIRAFERATPSSADPTLVSHQSLIESYAQMLDASYGALRRALIVATLMTLPMRGANFWRLLERAMQLLATDLRFAKSDIAEADRRLKWLDKKVLELVRKLDVQQLSGALELIFRVPETDLASWGDKLRTWMTAVFEYRTKLMLPPLGEHYGDWRKFLMKYLRARTPIFYTNLDDLLLRGAGTALPFPTDWSDLTYLHCAKALRLPEFRADTALLKVLLVELGFAREVARSIPKTNASQDDLDLLEICMMPKVQHNGERVLLSIGGMPENRVQGREEDGDSVILVEEAAGSVAAGWRISAQHAVLPVLSAELVRLGSVKQSLPEALSLGLFLYEAVHAGTPGTGPFPFGSGRHFRLAPPGMTAGSDVIVVPASLDAAVEEVTKRAS